MWRLTLGTMAIVLAAAELNAATVKVFLLGGQSNMRGAADQANLSPALRLPQEDVLFYFGSALTTLRPGSGNDFGPEISFGRALADALPAQQIALIKYAVGGTNLEHDWDPVSGDVYAAFRDTVARGLAALRGVGHTTELSGMLWTQGERDVVIGTTAQYETNLNEFIGDVRSRYGADLPFFVSQLSSGQTNLVDRASERALNEVRQAQADVAAGDPHSYLIVTDTFSLRSDNLHFSAAGQIALGEAFATSYLHSIPEPSWLAQLTLSGLVMMSQWRRRESEESRVKSFNRTP